MEKLMFCHHRVVDSGLQTSDFVRNATVYQFISSVEAKKKLRPIQIKYNLVRKAKYAGE